MLILPRTKGTILDLNNFADIQPRPGHRKSIRTMKHDLRTIYSSNLRIKSTCHNFIEANNRITGYYGCYWIDLREGHSSSLHEISIMIFLAYFQIGDDA